VSRYFWPDQPGGMYRASFWKKSRISSIGRSFSRGRQVLGSTQLPPLEASASPGWMKPM